MRRFTPKLWPRLLSGLLVLAYLEGIRALAGAPWQWAGVLIRGLFVQAVLESALWVGGTRIQRRRWMFTWRFVTLFGLLVGSMIVYVLTVHTIAAWVVSVAFYALLVAMSSVCSGWHWIARLAAWGLIVAIGGAFPVIAGQVESHFAEEEFFAALQAIALGICTGLIVIAHFGITTLRRPQAVSSRTWQGVSAPAWAVIAGSLAIVILGGGIAVRAYQRSFYAASAPAYPGLSRDRPFECGQGVADTATADGVATFERLLALVEANPHKDAPEYGMLALATGERRWAEAFRQAVLDDAHSGRFAEPANSVKFGQHLAARRAFYYPRVLEAFPDLFSGHDIEVISAWLTVANRRAQTVEWVDWLYALAFSYWPEGPYENQENGAGLLALLEAHHLASGTLSERNQAYLARNRRGWFERFRNTDDAYIYQPEWIDNALFQSEYWRDEIKSSPEAMRNQALAFEWLLLQALPDGTPLGYNHPGRVPLAQTAYLGASMLDDPRYVWWSARMLDWAERTSVPLYAQPGVEQATPLIGVSPDIGSCLIFGGSGLPTQRGPLAPDKIVFRDGWTPQSRYLLLNLRFSGWHRYKATNTITLLYQGGPLVIEQDSGEPFSWLPVGRSLFRDKRIPRENLNGLLISRTGMSAVLYGLTGFGGPWAQDPPHHARVFGFETGHEMDFSHTALENWRGWRHERKIYFYHDGPIVVVDRAYGPRASEVALGWHLATTNSMEENRISLSEGMHPVEAVLLPLGARNDVEIEAVEYGTGANTWLLYKSKGSSELRTVTVFLTGDWLGAQVTTNLNAPGGAHWRVVSGEKQIEGPTLD